MRIGSMQKRILSLMFNHENTVPSWTVKELLIRMPGAHRVSINRALRQLEEKNIVEKRATMPYGAGSRWEYAYSLRGSAPQGVAHPWIPKVKEYCRAEAAALNSEGKTRVEDAVKVLDALLVAPDLTERLAIIIIQELHND